MHSWFMYTHFVFLQHMKKGSFSCIVQSQKHELSTFSIQTKSSQSTNKPVPKKHCRSVRCETLLLSWNSIKIVWQQFRKERNKNLKSKQRHKMWVTYITNLPSICSFQISVLFTIAVRKRLQYNFFVMDSSEGLQLYCYTHELHNHLCSESLTTLHLEFFLFYTINAKPEARRQQILFIYITVSKQTQSGSQRTLHLI